LAVRKGEAECYEDLLIQSDALSDTVGTADERIELNNSTSMPILPGRWHVAPTNWNKYATNFTLSTWLETGMPIPAKPELFLTYDPIKEPLSDIDPVHVQPMGTGDTARGGGENVCICLCRSVCVERAQRAGGEMPRHDSLGSIPNQNSRLDASFGIHIKPINSTMGWIPGKRPLSSFRNSFRS
jgi:hypothetical protein